MTGQEKSALKTAVYKDLALSNSDLENTVYAYDIRGIDESIYVNSDQRHGQKVQDIIYKLKDKPEILTEIISSDRPIEKIAEMDLKDTSQKLEQLSVKDNLNAKDYKTAQNLMNHLEESYAHKRGGIVTPPVEDFQHMNQFKKNYYKQAQAAPIADAEKMLNGTRKKSVLPDGARQVVQARESEFNQYYQAKAETATTPEQCQHILNHSIVQLSAEAKTAIENVRDELVEKQIEEGIAKIEATDHPQTVNEGKVPVSMFNLDKIVGNDEINIYDKYGECDVRYLGDCFVKAKSDQVAALSPEQREPAHMYINFSSHNQHAGATISIVCSKKEIADFLYNEVGEAYSSAFGYDKETGVPVTQTYHGIETQDDLDTFGHYCDELYTKLDAKVQEIEAAKDKQDQQRSEGSFVTDFVQECTDCMDDPVVRHDVKIIEQNLQRAANDAVQLGNENEHIQDEQNKDAQSEEASWD